MEIGELVSRRTDLSTFVVHLTRTDNASTAKAKLLGIVASGRIEARNACGQAKSYVAGNAAAAASQKVACFTETPLEHIYLHASEIAHRELRFQPYGIALTKRIARRRGVNPVWYVDITPGHDWLTNPLNALIEDALGDAFPNSNIAKIAPFIEQMGTQVGGYRKEFWWEREWRHRGNFELPARLVGICPAHEHGELAEHAAEHDRNITWIDAAWGLEEIIGRLAGWAADDVNVM